VAELSILLQVRYNMLMDAIQQIDHILQVLNDCRVQYILIGGVNFLLHHEPVATFDVDFWIEDSDENRARCHAALVALGASWGPDDVQWRDVDDLPADWLARQGVFCLISRHGSIDLFRTVKGLGSWSDSRQRARTGSTAKGTPYVGLSDEDMLRCQLALSEEERKLDRVRVLKAALQRSKK
jgi:hypothetical protein